MARSLPLAGQGGNAALIIRATEVDDGGIPTKLSHSFEEIAAAVNAGLVVMAEVEGIYFQLTNVAESQIIFSFTICMPTDDSNLTTADVCLAYSLIISKEEESDIIQLVVANIPLTAENGESEFLVIEGKVELNENQYPIISSLTYNYEQIMEAIAKNKEPILSLNVSNMNMGATFMALRFVAITSENHLYFSQLVSAPNPIECRVFITPQNQIIVDLLPIGGSSSEGYFDIEVTATFPLDGYSIQIGSSNYDTSSIFQAYNSGKNLRVKARITYEQEEAPVIFNQTLYLTSQGSMNGSEVILFSSINYNPNLEVYGDMSEVIKPLCCYWLEGIEHPILGIIEPQKAGDSTESEISYVTCDLSDNLETISNLSKTYSEIAEDLKNHKLVCLIAKNETITISAFTIASGVIELEQTISFACVTELSNQPVAASIIIINGASQHNVKFTPIITSNEVLAQIDGRGYATKTELASYATRQELGSYALLSALENYATKIELNSYATKTETQQAISQVNTSLTQKIDNLTAEDVDALSKDTVIPKAEDILNQVEEKGYLVQSDLINYPTKIEIEEADYATESYVVEIAGGKCKAYIKSFRSKSDPNYVTTSDEDVLEEWLKTVDKSQFNSGDVFLIRDTGVPDYWWDNDRQTIQILETTKVPLELYVLKSELEAMHYLTSTDLKDYAKTTDLSKYALTSAIPINLSQLGEDSTHRLVTDTEKATWNAKSNFSGDYNDLTNKPTSMAADGGNADTVDGYHFVVANAAPTGVSDKTITLVI